MSRLTTSLAAVAWLAATSALAHDDAPPASGARAWQAGDHHVHSQFSVRYEPGADPSVPPTPILAGDARYPIPINAQMALKHGLDWMVSTDHGGPNHSKINRDQAYPELVASRAAVPGLIQFYGMEFDTPGGDHSSLIVPHTHHERDVLFDLEQRFSKRDAFPQDPSRDAEPKMLDALKHMKSIESPPVVIANHPSRSATAMGVYGHYVPREFRDWNDLAPKVAVGMEGSPGHQAGALRPDGSPDPKGYRGGYDDAPTLGGFDQMTARLGGFWDSMLAEGRGWWVTSTSDSHRHYTDGGNDFWPGEYAKTYVWASRTHEDILDGLRNGRVFVATGDLISELDVTARAVSRSAPAAAIGGRLRLARGQDVRITIRLRDPAGANHGGRTPDVSRVDLIWSEVSGPAADRATDHNPRARVERRFTSADWTREGEILTMTHTVRNVQADSYLRVRGASTGELEPTPDPAGENPWDDLWFYANPIFMDVAPAG
ncbi:MAG: phosphoesterase [Phenylobacterium sp.]|uniref:phosphoesterase n=1 Tax=Phenylobacterium sp. TaxID=1871053 RepID=UPI003BB6BAF7